VGVARKRLRGYANAKILLGEIDRLNLPDQSFDAALLSFVVHDIPAGERRRVLKALLGKVIPGGSIFLREPLQFLTRAEIDALASECGLVETSATVAEVQTQGEVFEGVYRNC